MGPGSSFDPRPCPHTQYTGGGEEGGHLAECSEGSVSQVVSPRWSLLQKGGAWDGRGSFLDRASVFVEIWSHRFYTFSKQVSKRGVEIVIVLRG